MRGRMPVGGYRKEGRNKGLQSVRGVTEMDVEDSAATRHLSSISLCLIFVADPDMLLSAIANLMLLFARG
jgi:hypothetical protein